MTKLAPYFKDYRAAGALNALIGIDTVIDENVFATKTGDLMMFFGLKGVDPECLDPEEIEAVTRAFESGLRSFDERFRIHQYLLKRPYGALPGERHSDPVADEAAQSRLRSLAARPGGLYRVENVLAVIYEGWHPASSKRSATSWLARPITSLRHRLSKEETEKDYAVALAQAKELLRTKSHHFVAQLRGTLDLRILSRAEAFRFLRRLLNYSPAVSEPVGLRSNHFLDAQVCSSHLECHSDFLRLGDHYVSVLTIKELPSQTFAQMLRGLMDLPCPFILASEWRREETGKFRSFLSSKRRHFHQSKTSFTSHLTDASPGASPDRLVNTGAAALAGDLGECLRALEVQNLAFGEFSLTVILYDSNPETLRRSVAQCFKIFAGFDAHLIEERYNRLNAFLAVVPGNSAFNVRRQWLSQTNTADLSFLFSADGGERRNRHLDSEYLAVLETKGGVPYFFNLHFEDVAHAFLIGATGSGKSFFLNFLLTHLQKYSPRTLIFDLGHSYESLTALFSGSYLSLRDEKRPFKINPFCLPPTTKNLLFLLSWVRVLAESGGYRLAPEQEQDLYEQIENLYQVSPAERRLSTLAHIVHRDIRREFVRWTEGGPYGDFFDNPTDTLTFASFQTFDFEGMSEMKEPLEALLFYVLHRASASVDDDPRRFKVFVMDEAWRFFSHPVIKSYMIEALKTWRKKNAALIQATQSADDLRSSDMLPAIVESCPTQIFLSNPRMDRNAYREAFHLNETEADLIAALAPKEELLIKRPDRSKVARLHVGPKEYWIYTSHPQERERRREIISRHGFREGLNILAKETPHE